MQARQYFLAVFLHSASSAFVYICLSLLDVLHLWTWCKRTSLGIQASVQKGNRFSPDAGTGTPTRPVSAEWVRAGPVQEEKISQSLSKNKIKALDVINPQGSLANDGGLACSLNFTHHLWENAGRHVTPGETLEAPVWHRSSITVTDNAAELAPLGGFCLFQPPAAQTGPSLTLRLDLWWGISRFHLPSCEAPIKSLAHWIRQSL